MKYLLKSPKLLTILFFFLLLLPSCNNEEVFVLQESQLISEEEEQEEENNTEDVLPPIEALDDEVITSENVSVDLELYLNDSNLPTSITLSNTDPSNGALTIDNNGTPNNLSDDLIIYTPNANFSGVDSFEYTICEVSNSENCDTALVTITVEANPEDIATELKAFPTAEGAGANSTGGRGGIVRHVTSLADDGSIGTLRWAINTPSASPVTVVFDVSGTINTGASSLNVNINNCTIAGQTAPRGGITIQGKWFGFYQAENLIMRYIRIVNTDYFESLQKSAAINGSGSNNCILDHVSMRYAWITPGITVQDNNDRNNGTGNFTIQRSIIGDCHTGGIVGSAVDSPRDALGGKNSVHHNLFVHVDHRFPNVSGISEVEIVENVIYNYRARLSTFFSNSKSNLINNTYKAGSASIFNQGGYNKIGAYYGNGSPLVYSSGNRRIDPNGNLDPNNDNWEDLFVIWRSGQDVSSPVTPQDEALYRQTTEFPDLGVPINRLGTDNAYSSVLSDVGANKFLNADGTYGVYLDKNDSEYVKDPIEETCYQCKDNGDLPDKTDLNQISYPTIPENTRPAGYDTDKDGMADIWETIMFGNLDSDGRGDSDGDGYSDLEEFLNSVDK